MPGLPSLDDLDVAALSARAREALELIAWPMVEHDLTVAEAAALAGVSAKRARDGLERLAAEWLEQAARGR